MIDTSIVQILGEYINKNTPLPSNICKDCGGMVVRKASGFFRGRFRYTSPACDDCGRGYNYAENTSTIGEKEFSAIMQKFFY